MRLRREHMGRSSTGMGKNAHVRCVAEGFQARLFFDGQVLQRAITQLWHLCIICCITDAQVTQTSVIAPMKLSSRFLML